MSEPFIHSHAICESKKIGIKTRIWAFSHVLPGAVIGQDCNICDHVFIENDVVLGDNVTVKCGVQLWDGLRVGNNVFIGPNVTFANDKYPRSKVYPDQFLQTIIKDGVSIGANATILPGITIGANAMIGAGTVVTKSVPDNALVVGNPGRLKGYVGAKSDIDHERGVVSKNKDNHQGALPSRVKGVQLAFLPMVNDLRGNLSVGEFERHIPFIPRRYFMVFDVPSKEVRGEHAHLKCHQYLICIKGECSVLVDDGVNREAFKLDKNNLGLYLPPMTWGVQYNYSHDAVLLVFASDYYDPSDYVRNYDSFKEIVATNI
jgi:UDP-2-acetamido-3-amino-2,3-dideoxy-glucuronate N-acetyltransferase